MKFRHHLTHLQDVLLISKVTAKLCAQELIHLVIHICRIELLSVLQQTAVNVSKEPEMPSGNAWTYSRSRSSLPGQSWLARAPPPQKPASQGWLLSAVWEDGSPAWFVARLFHVLRLPFGWLMACRRPSPNLQSQHNCGPKLPVACSWLAELPRSREST